MIVTGCANIVLQGALLCGSIAQRLSFTLGKSCAHCHGKYHLDGFPCAGIIFSCMHPANERRCLSFAGHIHKMISTCEKKTCEKKGDVGSHCELMMLMRRNGLSPLLHYIYNHQWNELFKYPSRYAPSQWEMLLHCNDVSHLLGTYLTDRWLLLIQAMAQHPAIWHQTDLYQWHYDVNWILRSKLNWNLNEISRFFLQKMHL